MKRALAILTLLFVVFAATAQSENSIIIDQNSFRPVQTDVLTGANVDPISVDSSRRPCARIKVKINRMTPEDINKIDVKIITNNQLTKCKTADYENGLILELTAKTATRFYFNHPEFGQSNEVILNLDPNKEYYMEASLNQLYSIVVNSNVEDAEVYVDNVYKGKTNSSFRCTIKNVLIGSHTLKLVYDGAIREQDIDVNSEQISFGQNFNVEVELFEVNFSIEPSKASIVIDGKMSFPINDGTFTLRLGKGTHSYVVRADEYHQQKGQFVVGNNDVNHKVILVPTYGWLNVKGDQLENAVVFIDDKMEGKVPIVNKKLTSGTYRVRIEKDMYKPYETDVTISDNETTVYSPTLDANFGWLQIGDTLAGASVYVNDSLIGTAPISRYTLIKGEYSVRIVKNLYKPYEEKIEIIEDQVKILSPDLEVDFATVSLSTVDDAELWVNGQYKGTGSWSGKLKTGSYTFEARKDKYHTQQISREITTQPPYQQYTLAPPVPITGNLKLKGVPDNAKVMLDGKKVTLPDNSEFNDLLIGRHNVEISKAGYKQFSQYITVREGETTAINASLSKYRRQIYWDTEYWESFNLGVFADAALLCDGDYFGLGLGVNWRLFRYYSVFIPTLGVRYMNDFDGSNMFGFSFVLNLHWGRLYTDSFSCYTGLGIEPIKYVVNYDDDYYDESYWDYAVVINWLGFGGRHHDFNIYSNLELDCGCISLGCRYTYYF
jgi:hypothetical protein